MLTYDSTYESYLAHCRARDEELDRHYPGLRRGTPILLGLWLICLLGYWIVEAPPLQLIFWLGVILSFAPLMLWPIAIAKVGPKPTEAEWARMREFHETWKASQNGGTYTKLAQDR